MKVFIVLIETLGRQQETRLLIMRKVYNRDAIYVRMYTETGGLTDRYIYNASDYSRAADLFLNHKDPAYKKILSFGEVTMS